MGYKKLILATLLAHLSCAPARVEPVAYLPVPVLRVSPGGARFTLAVDQQATWRWNRPETPESRLEYEWALQLDGAGGLAFGFQLFKIGTELASGSLADLVRAGQAAVWRTDGSRREVVHGAHLSILSQDSMLVFEITDRGTLELLFERRPERAMLAVMTPGRPLARSPIGIVYSEP